MCAQSQRLARRILLANSDQQVQQTVALVAAKYGHLVVRAATGAEALSLAASTNPDLVVLDTVLPDATGRDVLVRLKADARTARLPVVLWSGGREEGEAERGLALELGADDYVGMINVQLLLRRLERVLRRFSASAP
ncbi:MAG TPA: response regulator [Polyangiaceae bacterium]|jgi:DNA-binding response OmpR family regulator|nr:response regulator [Polyangiaceae bacterium]